MNVQIESAVLQEALRVALRLSPPLTGNVTLESDGAKLFLHSASELSRCTVILPCTVKGKALFAIPTESLRDGTKGHTDLTMVYDKTMLRITSGKYNVALTTVDAISQDEPTVEKGTTWKLSIDQIQWLKEAVAAVALKPTQNITTFMPVSIKMGKTGFVACYDNQKMAFINDREVQGELDVTLPLDTLTAVLDTFNKIACKMTVTPSALLVKNSLVDVSLSLPSTEEDSQIGTSAVMGKAKEALKVDGTAVEVSKTELVAFLDNARAVATKERSELSVKTEAGKVRLSVTTTNGTAKILLKANVDASTEFKIDFEYFDEAVRKCAESVVFKVVAGAFLTFKTAKTNILVALNQDQA